MKQLTVNRARSLGKDMEAKGIVILAFGDDGEFQAASYGRTKQDCGQLGQWLDGIYDAIESGEIAAPFFEAAGALLSAARQLAPGEAEVEARQLPKGFTFIAEDGEEESFDTLEEAIEKSFEAKGECGSEFEIRLAYGEKRKKGE